MNISPIILLSVGATFALLYGLIITFGWAITRKNRKRFHQSVGLNEIELYDLQTRKGLKKSIKTISLSNNSFIDEKGQEINHDKFNCYIVGNIAKEFPNIKKGYLIFMNRTTDKIEYAFDIPCLQDYR